MSADTISLKVRLVDKKVFKKFQFYPKKSVKDARLHIAKEMDVDPDQYGLFLPPRDDQNGIWFRDDYPLDFYGLEGEADQKEALLFSSKEAPVMEFVEFKKRYRPIKVAKGDNQYKTVMVDDTMNVAEAITHIITHVPTSAAISENELYNMGDDEVEVLSGDMTIREQGYVGECTTGLLKNEKGEISLYVKVPYFEGWIMRKRGGGLMKGLKNWNKRWYTLKKNKLVYHKAKGFGPEMGCILMKTVQAVRAATTGTDIPSKYVKSCFEVVTPGRTYIFLANNPNEMKKWVEILDFSRRMFAYETAFFGVANRTVNGKPGEVYSRSNLLMGNRKRGANGEEGGSADDDDTTSDEESGDERPKRRGGEASNDEKQKQEEERLAEIKRQEEEQRKQREKEEEERLAEIRRQEEEERKQREKEEEERLAEIKRIEEEQELKRKEEEQELARKQEEFLAKQQQLELEKQRQLQDQLEEDKRLEELMLQMELEQEERIKLKEEQDRVEKEREEIAKRLQEEQEKLRIEREILEKERIETEERIERERIERIQREEEERKRQEELRLAEEERIRVQEEEERKIREEREQKEREEQEREEQERKEREEEEERKRREEEENEEEDAQNTGDDDDLMEELDKEREQEEQKHIASRRLQSQQARLEAIEAETPELKFLLQKSSNSTPEDLLLAWANYIIQDVLSSSSSASSSSVSAAASASSSTKYSNITVPTASTTTTSSTPSSMSAVIETLKPILSAKQFSVSVDANLELYSHLLHKLEPQEFSMSEYYGKVDQVQKAEYIVQTLQSLGVEAITAEQILSTDENVHMNVLLTIYEEIGSNWQEEFQSQLVSKRIFASKYIYHTLAQAMPNLAIPSSPYELLECLRDGNILCHLINKIFKGIIDERVIEKNIQQCRKIENLSIAINAARALGSKYDSSNFNLETITPLQMHQLSWEVVELCLLQSANPSRSRNLFNLMRAETRNAFRALEPEKIMLRWFNYHLRKNSNRQINNFTDDMEDCENYAYLFDQIAPQISRKKEILAEKDWEKRAEIVIDMASKLGCLPLLTPTDIVETENSKLNLLFVGDIMRVCLALPTYKLGADEELDDFVAKSSEQSNNDQQLLQWINQMELGIPEVNNMLDDLKDGTVFLHVFDKVCPAGTVDPKKLKIVPNSVFKKLELCNYTMEICHKLKLNVAGIAGTDILNGDLRVNRAILLQIRRYLGDKVTVDVATAHQAQALKWANSKINPESKVKHIQSFKDQFLQDSLFFLALLDALVPGKQDRSLITPGQSEDDMEKNAKYFLTLAWSSSIPLVVVWEDVVKVRSKSIKHIIETLQDWDSKKQQ